MSTPLPLTLYNGSTTWYTFSGCVSEFVFCYFFIIETKNRTLEECAAIFDGGAGMTRIHDKAAIHAGLTHGADEIKEKGTQSESEVTTTN
ncbi:hypothetical protein EDB19DRAFT_1908934 [Suillus lakei]|nr:hypothetical protein EDB19DRAFT_1908934 [Suillus lakei]